MALLSSVLGTALGSAARVGSEAIREARERDALSIEQFKKNIQAKKEAFAKQQAAAQKANEKVQTVANFLQGQYKDKQFNAMELEDLAKQLIGISPENPQKYFLDNMDKIDFMPSRVIGTLNLPQKTGMKDVGLMDGKPVEAQPEFGERKPTDVPMSIIVQRQKAKEKTKPVVQQTASLLEPIRKKSFFTEALTGRDTGTLQREALDDLGVSEEQFNRMSSSLPDYTDRPKTALFSFGKIRPKDTFQVDQVVSRHAEILKMAENNPMMSDPDNVIVEQKDVPGTPKVSTKRIQAYYGYQQLWSNFSNPALGVEGRIQMAPVIQQVQNDLINSVHVTKKHKKLNEAVEKLSANAFKAIENQHLTLGRKERDKINFDDKFKQIIENKRTITQLQNDDANYGEAYKLAVKTDDLIQDLFIQLAPQIKKTNLKDKYTGTSKVIDTLINRVGLDSQFSSEDDRLTVLGDGTPDNPGLYLSFIDAIENDDEQGLRQINRTAQSILANLRISSKNDSDAKLENTIELLTNDFIIKHGRENLTSAVKFNIRQASLQQLFGGEIKKLGDGYVLVRPYAGSIAGDSGLVLEQIPFVIERDGKLVQQFEGMTDTKIREARKTNAKLLSSLNTAGEMIMLVQQDGILLGGLGDLRASYYNFADTMDVVAKRVFGSEMFESFTNEQAQIMLDRAKRLATTFVATAKNELFDDPRLSDQDLALVLNYIGVLNTASNKNALIGQKSALSALIGLERIFAKQRALTNFVLRGKRDEPVYDYSHFKMSKDGTPEIVLSDTSSFARETFLEIARSRGIDVNKFGKLRAIVKDGRVVGNEFVGFSKARVEDYFNNGGTYGFDGGGNKLDGGLAAEALLRDIKSIHEQVHYIMGEVSAFASTDSAEFRARSRTVGTPGRVNMGSDALKRQSDLLDSLDAIEPGLRAAFEASGRTLIGVDL